MTTLTTIVRRIIAVLKLSRKNAQFIIDARAIVAAIGAHSVTFPSPLPLLSAVTTDIDALQAAQNAAATRVKGAVQARNAAKIIVAKDLRDLRDYVQGIADANTDNAEDIILSAGMQVKTISAKEPRVFKAINSPLSGEVLLIAPGAPPRDTHEWNISPNGTTWTSLSPSRVAHLVVQGLTPGTKMYFRHRTVGDGPGPWSQTISITVT